jgi:hypothetical protein
MPISNQAVSLDWNRLTEEVKLLMETVARLNMFTNARAFGTTICKYIRTLQPESLSEEPTVQRPSANSTMML